jgi:hypothetical protein
LKFIFDIDDTTEPISESMLDEAISNIYYQFDSDCFDMKQVKVVVDSYTIVEDSDI